MVDHACLCPERHQAGLSGECNACKAYRHARRARRCANTEVRVSVLEESRPPRYLALVPQHSAIKEAIDAGMPYSQIALACGTTEWTLRAYLQYAGLYVPRTAPKAQAIDALVPKIKRLRKQGMTFEAIGRQVGASSHTVRRVCYGIRAPQPLTAAARAARRPPAPARSVGALHGHIHKDIGTVRAVQATRALRTNEEKK